MLTENDKKYLEKFSVKEEELAPVGGPLSEDDMEILDESEKMNEKYGDSGVRTFVESAISSATFGLSDQAYASLGDDFKEALRERRKRNEGAALTGEIAGIVGPALFSGGSSLIAKGAGAAGKGVATAAKAGAAIEKLTAKSLNTLLKESGKKKFAREVLKKSVSKGAGSAVEGTFYGIGELIEENALGNAEFNAENLAAYGGKGALFGGLVGGSLGGIGKTVSIVVPKIKGSKIVGTSVEKIDNFKQNMTNPVYNAMKLGGFADDEIERLLVEQTKMAQNIPDVLSKVMKSEGVGKSLLSNRNLLQNSRSYLDKIGKQIGKTVKAIDDEVPNKAIFPTASDIAGKQIDELQLLKKKFQRPDGSALNKEALSYVNRIDDEIDGLWKKDILNNTPYTASQLQDMKIKFHKLGRYDKTGIPTVKDDINRIMGKAVRDELVDFAGRVDSTLGKQLQSELVDYNSLVTFVKKFNKKIGGQTNFPRLRDIFFGLGAYTYGMAPTSAAGMAALTSAFAKSDLKNKMMVLANIERSNTKVSNKIFKSMDKFFKKTRFDKYPAISAAVLTNNPLARETDGDLVKGKPRNERDAIKNIADNIEKIQTTPAFLDKMMLDANLQASAPKTYQQLRQVAKRAVLFLDTKLPRKTLIPNPFLKKSYPTSDQEIYKFKKYLKAVQNPLSVLDDLNSGNVSREGIEAVRYVYPTIYSEMQSNVYDALEKAGGASYKQRLQLGILLDIPTDLALEPEAIRGLQSFYKEAQESQSGGAISASAAKQLDLAESQATELEKVSNRRDLT
jgi:hypothetical protein